MGIWAKQTRGHWIRIMNPSLRMWWVSQGGSIEEERSAGLDQTLWTGNRREVQDISY